MLTVYSDDDVLYLDDFVKTVLSWPFATYEEPLTIAVELPPLPRREDNVKQYYYNFLPFILEEARSIIAEGLERVKLLALVPKKSRNKKRTSPLNEAKSFDLVLKKKPRFPRNEDNPLSMIFSGAIPEKIEHGRSMNVLLLKTKANAGVPEKRMIALASESFNGTELFVKIVISYVDYDNYRSCFTEGVRWHAHYLGSLISEERMYGACLTATDTPCVRQIARSQIPKLRFAVNSNDATTSKMNLNLSQKRAVQAFLSAQEQSTLLLQGPPGTGKTTTLVHLLKQVAAGKKRILVSAHSNKGVQVLASRAIVDMSDVPMILVGVEGKISETLKPIFLNRWYDFIADHLSAHHNVLELLAQGEFLEVEIPTYKILSDLRENLNDAQCELNKFGLILNGLAGVKEREKIFELTANPFSRNDFEYLQKMISTVAGKPHHEKYWERLLDALSVMQEKWRKIKKYQLEKYLLNYARIIFSTLITSGRDSMLEMDNIDFLLVDEAAQSVEAATLIPMRYKPRKVLLVGDTKQLPATIISKFLDDDAKKDQSKNYKWSMMWRLIEENKQPNMMLTVQYRMHPYICRWPSSQYYRDRLITAPDILPMKQLSNVGITSRPYAIYQVHGEDIQASGSHSICNREEAKYVADIVRLVGQEYTEGSIGIITPYSAQKRLIQEHLGRIQQGLKVDVNTVDGFQGDERDIIILSFTRTHVSQFLREFRRLNVAITRPKFCLIILGSPGLISNDIGEMMEDAKRRDLLYSEQELRSVLATRRVCDKGQASAANMSLELRAWREDASSQFLYAKRIEVIDKPTAIVWFRRAAENGYAQAQYWISQFYFSDQSLEQKDIFLGAHWLQKSARQNFPQAQYALGMEFLSGEIFAKNIEQGISWCQRAAEKDFICAILFLAKCYEQGIDVLQNEIKAQAYYRRGAKLDNEECLFKLAAALFNGNEQNKREAIKWYRKLAEKGKKEAYYPFAKLLINILNHYEEGLEWYIEAANAGNIEAQYEIALCFKEGRYGCNINLSKSAFYFGKAATSGHTESQFIYAMCLKEGIGIDRDEKRAMLLLKKAADKGHTEAQYHYARLKEKETIHESYIYYRKAALKNHELALYASIDYQVRFNHDLTCCLIFCEKLAERKDVNISIQFILARLLDSGIAGKVNRKKSYEYYALLAEKEHSLAQYYCALMLEEGIVVPQNIELACRYYEKCVDHVIWAKPRLARLLLQNEHYADDEKIAAEMIDMLTGFYVDSHKKDKNRQEGGDLNENIEYLTNRNNSFDLGSFIFSINTASSYANYTLGMMLKEGHGVIQNCQRAMVFLKKAADCGHVEAQYQFAVLRAPFNRHEAYGYYRKAAEAKHILAQYACFYYQIESNCDLPHCLALYGELSLQESGPSKFQAAKLQLARLLLQDKEYAQHERKALEMLGLDGIDANEKETISPIDWMQPLEKLILQDAHDLSNFSAFITSINTHAVNANYVFGLFLKDNGGNNRLAAMAFLKKAADRGHIEAQYQFALLKGAESPQEAYAYYKKAAMENHPLAQRACITYQIVHNCDLALCLRFCCQLASEAKFSFNFVLARLLDSGIAGRMDKSAAYLHYLKAAQNGHKLASYYTATMLAQGIGVNQDLALANQYYRNCLHDCFEAQLGLACLLLTYRSYCPDAQIVAEKEKEATKLLKFYYEHYTDKKSSLLNDIERVLEKAIMDKAWKASIVSTPSIEANYYLGKIFEEGKGVPVNAERALFYYQCAAQSMPDAEYRMGYIHEFGVGNIARNKGMAQTFYQRAANKGHDLAAKRLTWSYSLFSVASDVPDATLAEKKEYNCLVM